MKDYQSGLTAESVRAMFRYAKSTGELIRRTPVYGRGSAIQYPVGSVAGCIHKDGYVYIAIRGRLYVAHRLAYLIATGEWPAAEIDHRNGIRSDNRWKNIRPASISQNRSNTLGQSTRTGPYPGVYCRTTRSGVRYIAQIKHRKKVIYLGSFLDAKSARNARVSAEKLYFGQYGGSQRG